MTPSDAALVSRFRRAVLGLGAAAAAGAAAELAMLRHWNGVEQLVPWATLAAVTAGMVLVALGRSRTTILTGRVIGLAAGLASLFGVYEHIASNYRAGPLDFRYTDRWPTMSAWSRWWAAASGAVGPSPVLAPAILALAGACLVLATMGRAARSPRGSVSPLERLPPPECRRAGRPATAPVTAGWGSRDQDRGSRDRPTGS